MKLLAFTFICTVALVFIGSLAFGLEGKMVLGESARAAGTLDSFAPQAQAPGWSRGQQSLAISYDECVRRMPAALQAEGYSKDPNSGGNFVAGSKAVHTAVIICGPAPEAKMLVQIVVASNGEGGGRERQQLQAQMDQPSASSQAGLCREGNPGQPVRMIQSSDSLTFVNESGNKSRGHFENSTTVVADEWEGGLRGTVSSDGIRWANNTNWLRCR
jgi:hypothetical protein